MDSCGESSCPIPRPDYGKYDCMCHQLFRFVKLHVLSELPLVFCGFAVGAGSPDFRPRYLTGDSGRFTSPNYGGNYYDNANMSWLIESSGVEPTVRGTCLSVARMKAPSLVSTIVGLEIFSSNVSDESKKATACESRRYVFSNTPSVSEDNNCKFF